MSTGAIGPKEPPPLSSKESGPGPPSIEIPSWLHDWAVCEEDAEESAFLDWLVWGRNKCSNIIKERSPSGTGGANRPPARKGGLFDTGPASVGARKTMRGKVRFQTGNEIITEPMLPYPLKPGQSRPPPFSKNLEEERNRLVWDKLAESSQRVFANQLQWWKIFCKIKGVDPIWRENAPDLERENLVLDFIVHSGVVLNKSPGTVKVRLAAVRSHHLALGLPDPFYHMPRVAMALAGLKRRYGHVERRHPVTTRMLAWLKKNLKPKQSHDGAILWAGLCIGFFFLLRASEYLKPHYQDKRKGLSGHHVTLCVGGEPATLENFRSADEVRITIQGSKTDIYNKGEHRNHFANFSTMFEERLCVVEACILLCAHDPSRFFGTNVHEPLLVDKYGEHLSRETVQTMLKLAALNTGLNPEDFGTHSLRFGGASALWAAFHDTGLIKRWGRWATDSFQTYLWEDRKGATGIAAAMASTDITPS